MKVSTHDRDPDLAKTAQNAPASGITIVDADGNFIGQTLEEILAEIADALAGGGGIAAPDLAADGTAWTRNPLAPDFAIVQSAGGSNVTTLNLPATPTPGNLLVVWQTCRAATVPLGPAAGTWTAHPGGIVTASGGAERGGMWYRVAEAGEPTAITLNNSTSTNRGPAFVVEVAGVGFLDDSAEAEGVGGTGFSIDVTPSGDAAFLIAGAVEQVSDTVGASNTPDTNTTELFDSGNPGPTAKPQGWVGYRLVTAAGTYAIGGTCSQSVNKGLQAIAFAMATPLWDVPAPNVNDEDDGSFEEVGPGTDVVMIDLGAEYNIVRTRLLIGTEFAGAKTYVIRGSVDPAFDPDLTATLATLDFTATGSFTVDEVEATWAAGVAYRYLELTGDDETRRVYSWELYEAPLVLTVGGLVVGPGPGGVGEVPIANGDGTATWTDLEDFIAALDLWLSRVGGGKGTVNALGDLGALALVDLALGNYHHGTLTEDCVVSTAGWTDERDCQITFRTTQGGAGGHALTIGGVTWDGGVAPTPSTAAGVEVEYILTSVDGGATIRGSVRGGGGPGEASDISVADADGWFAGATVEAVLAELAAKAIGYQPHGAMGAAEPFDAATNWHSGTFDDDCTFSLTPSVTDTSSLFLELLQDGTGGHQMTLPASVVNRVALEAAQDTTAGTTSFLVLLSRDNGTTWYGGWWGSGGSAIEVLDEGGPLTAALESIDFVGAGVNAIVSGDAVTVTIPGTPTGAAGGDLAGTYPNPSVVDDSHSHTAATLPAPTGTSPSDASIWRPLMDGAGAVLTDGTGQAVMAYGPA